MVAAQASHNMTEREAAEYLGLSVYTLQQWRFRGQKPDYLKLGKAVRYREADLVAFIESCRVSTGQGGAA